MKKFIAAALTAIALLIPSAVPVSAHMSDGSVVCNLSFAVVLVVFDGKYQTGARDDWCVPSLAGIGSVGDSDFSVNGSEWADDIGDHYLMDGFVSSWSIESNSTHKFALVFYPDPHYGGIPVCKNVGAGVHIHDTFVGLYDNTIDSAAMVIDQQC